MEDRSHVIISCGGADHSIVAWDLETTGGWGRGKCGQGRRGETDLTDLTDPTDFSDKRASILVDDLDQAKNVKYHISHDGTQVLAWCTDSVPFPNLVFVDVLNNAKTSVYSHEGLVRHAVFG